MMLLTSILWVVTGKPPTMASFVEMLLTSILWVVTGNLLMLKRNTSMLLISILWVVTGTPREHLLGHRDVTHLNFMGNDRRTVCIYT